MFGNIFNLFKKKSEDDENKSTAKERLHLVLMQDRANVSADFLDLMKQEIIEVIKKYIEVDENQIDVKLTNKVNGDGTTGAPALYANIPIKSLKKETRINLNKELLKEHDSSNSENNSTEIAQNDIEIVEIKEENDKMSDTQDNKIKETKNEINESEEEDNKNDVEKNEKEETAKVQQEEENTNNNTNEEEINEDENDNNEEEKEKLETENNSENKNENSGNNKNKKKNRKKKKNEGTTFFENIKNEENKTDEK